MPVNAMQQTTEHRSDHASNGGRLVSTDGRQLPLESATLQATAEGGLARTTLKQVFSNPHQEPLQVVYTMPLPPDGAVSGYEFLIGERRVTGEVRPREQARKDFERALVEGRTAGLLEQERANLFTQKIGNVPPGQKVTVDLVVDQKLTWLDEGMWEWRFPTVAGPRYLGAEGRVTDAARVTVDVADRPLPVRVTLDLSIGDTLAEGPGPDSPSHAVTIRARNGATAISLSSQQGVPLDRDIVVRWAVPRPDTSASLQVARLPVAGGPDSNDGRNEQPGRNGRAFGLLTVVPPGIPEATRPRDLILLIDTSGSMHGHPIRQAKRVARALIDSLQETDSLEMIEFSSAPRRWHRRPIEMSPHEKGRAFDWVDDLQAGGATEMLSAVEAALKPLRTEAVRQVILLTDGYIGFESEVVGALRRHLPAGSRLHAVGIGSAVNTALLHPAARAGRGVHVIIGLDEDVERGASRLLKATRDPVVTDLHISGDAIVGMAPRALPDLLAGAPVMASLELRPEGGHIALRGRTARGSWQQEVVVPPVQEVSNPAIARLYGREAVEDLEVDLAAGDDRHSIDSAIERIGVEFQIATRQTSWVAISDQIDVDPRRPSRRTVIPQELPYGTSAEGMGLRSMGSGFLRAATVDSDAWTVGLFDSALPPSAARMILGPPLDELAAARQAQATDTKEDFRGRWLDTGLKDVQIIEFEVSSGNLQWTPPDQVTLILKDGRSMPADIDDGRSTAPGEITTGCLVRLALRINQRMRKKITAIIVGLGDRMIGITM